MLLSRQLLILFFVLIAAYVQMLGILRIGDVSPNLLLVLVIVLSFFISRTALLACAVLLGAAVLLWQPGLNYELLALIAVLFAAIFLRKFIRWQALISGMALIGIATLVFITATDALFVVRHPVIVLGEFAYNMILGGAFLALGSQFQRKLI